MVETAEAASAFEDMIGTVTGLDVARVPEELLRHAALTFADTVGVCIGGFRQPEMHALTGVLAEQGLVDRRRPGSPGRASLLTTGGYTTDPARAAFLNGTAGSFLELDEGMRPTGHAGMHVLPAALAVGEAVGAPAREVFRAALVGYEAVGRLFAATKLRYPVHPHGHLGAAGAAVAGALLLGIDPLLPARIALTTPLAPVWDACFDGATARNTYMGVAAQTGVMACYLAKAGFTGSPSAYGVTFGSVLGDLVDLDALRAPLDHGRLRITQNYLKRHSACALSHAAIDAVLQMDLPPGADVQEVLVETVANNMKLDRLPEPNALSIRFSLPYAVATAIRTGRTDPEAFAAHREDVAELAARVRVSVAEDLDEQWPEFWSARVTVRWAGGTMQREVRNPRGHHDGRLTAGELEAKFTGLAGDGAARLWAELTTLHERAEPLSVGVALAG